MLQAVNNDSETSMQPDELEIRDGGASLRIVWRSGQVSDLSAEVLWNDCPSAQARRRRLDGRLNAIPPGLTVRSVEPVGRYGVNIIFSDGNDRGVYPWAMLSALATRPKMDDFIVPAKASAA